MVSSRMAREDLKPMLPFIEILLLRPKWIRTHLVSSMANRILNQISRVLSHSTANNVSGLQQRESLCQILETTNKTIRLWLSSSTISRVTRSSITGECLRIEKILKTSEHYDLNPSMHARSSRRNVKETLIQGNGKTLRIINFSAVIIIDRNTKI